MKNRIITYIIIIIVVLMIFNIINFFVFGFNGFDDKITNKKWYHYDYTTGYYDILEIDKESIKYKSSNSKYNYDNCYSYYYDKKNNIIKLNCDINIKINKYSENTLELKINEYENVFFNNIEDSLNYEFKNYFGKSIVDYKDEKSQALEYSKINTNKLLTILKENGYYKILFLGNNCTSIDCFLSLDIMEKWITKTQNIYFVDSNELNIKIVNEINRRVNNDINYNNIYPKVLVIKNGKIIDDYDLKCSGFNCNDFYKNEF